MRKKSVFYSKNIQYAHNFYGTELYVNKCRGVFRTQSNICEWTSFYMLGDPVMNELKKKVQFVIKFFVAADKLNTFKLLKTK